MSWRRPKRSARNVGSSQIGIQIKTLKSATPREASSGADPPAAMSVAPLTYSYEDRPTCFWGFSSPPRALSRSTDESRAPKRSKARARSLSLSLSLNTLCGVSRLVAPRPFFWQRAHGQRPTTENRVAFLFVFKPPRGSRPFFGCARSIERASGKPHERSNATHRETAYASRSKISSKSKVSLETVVSPYSVKIQLGIQNRFLRKIGRRNLASSPSSHFSEMISSAGTNSSSPARILLARTTRTASVHGTRYLRARALLRRKVRNQQRL